jgi:hypothetical protein
MSAFPQQNAGGLRGSLHVRLTFGDHDCGVIEIRMQFDRGSKQERLRGWESVVVVVVVSCEGDAVFVGE